MDKKVFLLALITIIAWSSGLPAIRSSLFGGFEPISLVLYRFIIASIVFLIFAFITRTHFKWPKKEDLLHISLVSFLGVTIFHLSMTFGTQYVEAGTTGMIVGSAPIFTTIIAILFLKEKMEWYSWLGLFIGFIGITLITLGATGAHFNLSKGLIYIIIATISSAFFYVYQKPLFKKYHPIELTAHFTWIGTIPMLIFLPSLINNLPNVTFSANIAAIYVGIVPAAICYAAWAVVLSLGDVSKASNLLYLEPAFIILIAWIWLNELPSMLSIIGGGVIILSVLVVQLLSAKDQKYKQRVQLSE